MDKDTSCKPDFLLSYIEAFMLFHAPQFNKKSHPIHPSVPSNGSPVAIHTNESCLVGIPRVHFLEPPSAVVPYPKTLLSYVCICATLFS